MAYLQAKHTGRGKTPLINAFIVCSFRKAIWDFYKKNRRDLPWRRTKDPYRILVSEVMLQQTQVERVLEKYLPFLTAFPDIRALDRAPLRSVLRLWQGLGYNRRALALKESARIVVEKFNGLVPSREEDLRSLPWVGRATAAAVRVFAFGLPAVFVETNIRRVFLHFFFPGREGVSDEEIVPLVERTLERARPREWYWALMDYGTTLKKENANPNRRSAHYRRQSPFEGSNRQVRGLVLKALVRRPAVTELDLVRNLHLKTGRVQKALLQLEQEGFLRRKGPRRTRQLLSLR